MLSLTHFCALHLVSFSSRPSHPLQVDLGSRDAEFVAAVKQVRQQLLEVAGVAAGGQFTTVLMQGSGTFGNEAVIGSAVPRKVRLLLICYSVMKCKIWTKHIQQ